ncbi:HAD-IA family hydrolase [Streptomyces sp. NPDC006482]|uniref:HAD-IA family hydrolase n=1 Tax=unclassified Streptomyces TaxID=2593676 RepID=UPI0022554F7C|nr:HAD-IA family hydrolase [Streptomyces sp. NBC_00094]MCX5391937.1 HAD-IA family hydrolase [Streptomyces sp. NBC_00094]
MPGPPDPTGRSWSVRAFLFDLDGTLVDSMAAIERHTVRWAQRVGVAPEPVLSLSHGRRDEEFIPLVAPWADAEEELHWLHRLSVEDTEGISPLPGVRELLAALGPESWAVVTSAAREVAESRLAAAGLPRPVHLVCAEDVTHGKPDPEGFLRGAALLGVPAAACLAVEDSKAGVRAAQDAGAYVLAVGEAAEHADHGRHLRDVTVRSRADGGLQVCTPLGGTTAYEACRPRS